MVIRFGRYGLFVWPMWLWPIWLWPIWSVADMVQTLIEHVAFNHFPYIKQGLKKVSTYRTKIHSYQSSTTRTVMKTGSLYLLLKLKFKLKLNHKIRF